MSRRTITAGHQFCGSNTWSTPRVETAILSKFSTPCAEESGVSWGTKYKADGCCASTNTVYEFNGCLWHGCKKCYKDNRQTTAHPRTKQSLEELYALTKIKETTLLQLGYKYVCIWEHDWLEMVNSESEVEWFVSQLDVQSRLEPRDSFFGGRTNASKLSHVVKGEEMIKYVDFTRYVLIY